MVLRLLAKNEEALSSTILNTTGESTLTVY